MRTLLARFACSLFANLAAVVISLGFGVAVSPAFFYAMLIGPVLACYLIEWTAGRGRRASA